MANLSRHDPGAWMRRVSAWVQEGRAMRRTGFTLIELLVVIAIMTVLTF